MKNIISILKSVGAMLENDHFVLTTGKHAEIYFNKDALYPHTKLTSDVCKLYAEKVKDIGIDTVVGPALGGIILSQWTAHHLSKMKKKEVYGVYLEKKDGELKEFTRGYDKYVKGKNVLVVEDITNTGGSAKKVVDVVRATGGNVVGVCVMVNRLPGVVNSDFFGAPFFPLAEYDVKCYEEADCPFCKEKRPINTQIGHGKKYLQEKGLL